MRGGDLKGASKNVNLKILGGLARKSKGVEGGGGEGVDTGVLGNQTPSSQQSRKTASHEGGAGRLM